MDNRVVVGEDTAPAKVAATGLQERRYHSRIRSIAHEHSTAPAQECSHECAAVTGSHELQVAVTNSRPACAPLPDSCDDRVSGSGLVDLDHLYSDRRTPVNHGVLDNRIVECATHLVTGCYARVADKQ